MSVFSLSYPISFKTFLAISSALNFAFVVTCPAIVIKSFEANVSTATLDNLSCFRHSSNMLSEIKSHTLSGCPSVTLSDVK